MKRHRPTGAHCGIVCAWMPTPETGWSKSGIQPVLPRRAAVHHTTFQYGPVRHIRLCGGWRRPLARLDGGAGGSQGAARPAGGAAVLGTGPRGRWCRAVYLMFLLLWGFNYRRLSMADRLMISPGAPDGAAVTTLGLEAAAQLNRLHAGAHSAGWRGSEWRDERLTAAFASTQRALSDAPLAQPGRLKWTLFGFYFRWAGVDGMVDPFALEALANPDLLPWERPFVAAHEWAHLAGYAHEAEANFVGWLTCVRADAPAQSQRLVVPVLGDRERSERQGSNATRGGPCCRAAKRRGRDHRATAPRTVSAPAPRELARIRPVPAGQSGRGRDSELRGGRESPSPGAIQ